MQAKESRRDAKQGRVVGLVIAISMVIWIVAQSLGPYRAIRYTYRFFSTGGFPLGHNIWNANVAVASN